MQQHWHRAFSSTSRHKDSSSPCSTHSCQRPGRKLRNETSWATARDRPHKRSLKLPKRVTLSEAKGLARQAARCFPFAEFTLERSEGLRASAHALSMTMLYLPAAPWLASPCGRPCNGGPP